MKLSILNLNFQWRPGHLARGTFLMTVGLGLRTLGQAVVFLIIVRFLSVEEYGAYSAVLALAMSLSWFTGLGSSAIMLRDTSRSPELFAKSWGTTVAIFLITLPVAGILYALLARLLLPIIDWGVIICFGLAEICFIQVVHVVMQVYQGHERMGRAARMQFIQIVPRLIAALIFSLISLTLILNERLFVWSWLYLLSTMAAAAYALWRLHLDLAVDLKPQWEGIIYPLREGWPYAIGSAASKVYVDIDKLMLARLAGLEPAGIYAAAYRLVDIASLPLASLSIAVVPRFFRAGGEGISSALRYALRLLPVPAAYAAAVGIVLHLFAEFSPWLLGPGYSKATEALRWLAWMPLVSLPRTLLQLTMICADHQRSSLLILLGGAIFNVLCNLWMIPRWGWQGAVAATYAAELFMTVFYFLAMFGRFYTPTKIGHIEIYGRDQDEVGRV